MVLSHATLMPLYLALTLLLLSPVYIIATGFYHVIVNDYWLLGGVLIVGGFMVVPGASGALVELKKTIFG